MKTTKRLLGLVLALAMLLTMASFPAFADESYTYTPKNIVLEASMQTAQKAYSEIKYIARPSTLNLYAGDKLVLPNGGLKLNAAIKTAKNAAGTSVTPTGLVIDVFQNYGHLDYTAPENLAIVDGKTRFYFAYDSSTTTITGIYPTMADMVADTNELDGITLGKEGFWAVGMKWVVYHTSAADAEFISYVGKNYWDFNTSNYGTAPYMFFLDVEAAPTSADYEVSAPAVPAVTTATLTSGTDFQIYGRTITGDTTTCAVSEDRRSNIVHNASTNRYAGSMMGWELEFEAPAYLESLKISFYSKQFDYVVYGSLDGNNWYQIKGKTIAYPDQNYNSKPHAISVGGVAKYFRVEIVDIRDTTWGSNASCSAVSSVKGALNVLAGNTVTVEGDATGEFTTDANGKLGDDFATFLATYPAGKVEGGYIYRINGIDVSNKIATYVFTSATTVTVEKYVVPTGHVVTFVGDQGSIEVEANGEGYYEVPAEYKGNYSFYEDAAFETKLDTTLPVNGATTVYVKTIQWTAPAAKTVAFQLREGTDNSLAFNNLDNSPLILPARTTLYVGDTIVIPHEVYKDLIAGYADAVEIKNLTVVIYGRGRTSTESTSIEDWSNWEKTDPTYTFSKPGYYTLLIDKVMYTKADGTTGRSSTSEKPYICAFEVKEKPTTAPTATPVPSYNGAEGEVTALLADNFNTSVAFKKSFGAGKAYTDGILSIDNAFGNVNGDTHPVMHALYLQFNLDALSYVDNISIGAKNYNGDVCYPIHEYDVYGSTNNKDWYLLNFGFDNNGVYNVQGVAKYIRIVPRTADGWYAKINTYSVNGYAISEDAVSATSNPTWVKDGVKVEIASEKDLPVAYSSGDKNYAITGWKVDTGSGLDDVSLALIAERNFKELGTLVPVVTEVPVKAASLTGTLAPAGQDIIDGKTFSGKYINGFYVEGTQIRIPEGTGETEIKGGLRFVNILDNALIAELDELRTAGTVLSYEYGTLAMASTKYTGGDLVIGYNQYCKKVVGERIFARAENFDNAYFKYTVCVTGITEANYTKDVMVRPYITINMADDSSVTLYGEQYQTSLYAAAKLAKNDPENSAETIAYLDSIIDAVG